VAERSGDTAFGRKTITVVRAMLVRARSGVALRFPPQSKRFVVAHRFVATTTLAA
jgi:hypothetical protein